MNERTPLPWDVVEATENHGPYIVTAFGTTVCDLYAMTDPNSNYGIIHGEKQARPINHADAVLNAPLIVRAVNNHGNLIAALEWIAEIADKNYEQDDKLRSNGARTLIRIADKAREATAKATAP